MNERRWTYTAQLDDRGDKAANGWIVKVDGQQVGLINYRSDGIHKAYNWRIPTTGEWGHCDSLAGALEEVRTAVSQTLL